MKPNKWLRLIILLVILIAISFGLAYLLQNLVAPLQDTVDKFAWLAYLSVFGTTLLINFLPLLILGGLLFFLFIRAERFKR